jgi:hypothetical protein
MCVLAAMLFSLAGVFFFTYFQPKMQWGSEWVSDRGETPEFETFSRRNNIFDLAAQTGAPCLQWNSIWACFSVLAHMYFDFGINIDWTGHWNSHRFLFWIFFFIIYPHLSHFGEGLPQTSLFRLKHHIKWNSITSLYACEKNHLNLKFTKVLFLFWFNYCMNTKREQKWVKICIRRKMRKKANLLWCFSCISYWCQ